MLLPFPQPGGQRPNARRVSSAKQDFVFAKSPRKCYKRTAYRVVSPVRTAVYRQAVTDVRRYPNLHEVRLIPTKRDIAFVEYFDAGSATAAKDALHNYKLDEENKIQVRLYLLFASA